jgi:hypothetical protein
VLQINGLYLENSLDPLVATTRSKKRPFTEFIGMFCITSRFRGKPKEVGMILRTFQNASALFESVTHGDLPPKDPDDDENEDDESENNEDESKKPRRRLTRREAARGPAEDFQDGNNQPHRTAIWGRRYRSAGCHEARRNNRDHACSLLVGIAAGRARMDHVCRGAHLVLDQGRTIRVRRNGPGWQKKHRIRLPSACQRERRRAVTNPDTTNTGGSASAPQSPDARFDQ